MFSSVACLAITYFSTLSHKLHNSLTKFPERKEGFHYLYDFYLNISHSENNSTRDYHKSMQVRKQYQTEISNRFAALQNFNDDEDVNRTWENSEENIKTSAKESLGLHELKQHKTWFDEECLGFLDQRKRAKMQWVKDPSQSNVDNLNNVRRDVSGHFRNKKKA